MDAIASLLGPHGPYWIPGTAIIAVAGLVVFYLRGGRRGQEERVADHERR